MQQDMINDSIRIDRILWAAETKLKRIRWIEDHKNMLLGPTGSKAQELDLKWFNC